MLIDTSWLGREFTSHPPEGSPQDLLHALVTGERSPEPACWTATRAIWFASARSAHRSSAQRPR